MRDSFTKRNKFKHLSLSFLGGSISPLQDFHIHGGRVELIVNINLNFLKRFVFKNAYLGFWSRNYTEGILPGLHYGASKRLFERTKSADFYLWAN